MTDLTNAAAPANEPSLRDTLAAEWSKAEAPETPAAPVAEPAAKPASSVDEVIAAAAQRIRDEKGRFTKEEEDAAQAATKPAEAAQKPDGEKPAVEPGKEAEAPAKAPVGPPTSWSIEAKADFDMLPDAVKEAVAKREGEINNGFAKLKDYKAIESQHSAQAQQYGVPLPEFINRLAAADKFLQTQPIEAIKWLAQTYKIDLGQLGAPAQPGQQAAPQQQPQHDAVVQPLMEQIQALQQIVYGDKRNQINSQVEAFFADPKNKYSENVADQMVVLINEAKRAHQQVDLPSIYETACFMNPEVRAALIKEQTGKVQSEQIAKAKQTADQARAAGASITGGPSATPPPVSPNLDLRATLEQSFAAAAGRA